MAATVKWLSAADAVCVCDTHKLDRNTISDSRLITVLIGNSGEGYYLGTLRTQGERANYLTACRVNGGNIALATPAALWKSKLPLTALIWIHSVRHSSVQSRCNFQEPP
ncbi:hypothetical protein SBA7_560005 [Candidatus Sulfotelmatobacter sp. SbA7]|nr:hypothetical protein SBA7_560005 [Candidatus Sulfotelmatobacter sp. SbA7]